MGHTQPSMFAEDIKMRIAEVAKAGIKALGIDHGPSHTEIKLTSTGPKIVEIGARLGETVLRLILSHYQQVLIW